MIPVEVNTDRYFEMIHKAHKQAITEGIKANAIIINEKHGKGTRDLGWRWQTHNQFA